ncbi:MAG: tetratricopeptide repeat protein, partial [Pirellula sp.]
MRIGQVDRAIEAYQNALALTPSADEMRRGLADALISSNRLKEALDEFGQISDSVAKDYLRACEVMLSMQSSGSQDTALWDRFDEAFKKALELSPSDPFLIERPWTLELLQLDSAIMRSKELQDSQEGLKFAQQRLDELGQKYTDSVELQRLLIQR